MRRLIAVVLCGTMFVSLPRFAIANELDEACNFVDATLKTVRGAQVRRTTGSFTANGHRYYGCIISLNGDSTNGPEAQLVTSLLSPEDDSFLYKAGWRRVLEFDADGPDGTSFRIVKGDTLCDMKGDVVRFLSRQRRIGSGNDGACQGNPESTLQVLSTTSWSGALKGGRYSVAIPTGITFSKDWGKSFGRRKPFAMRGA